MDRQHTTILEIRQLPTCQLHGETEKLGHWPLHRATVLLPITLPNTDQWQFSQ